MTNHIENLEKDYSTSSLSARIVQNVFSNWANYGIAVLIAFFLSPFVVHTLGNTGYGIWILITSVTGYLGLLDLGVTAALVRYVSKFKALQDSRRLNDIICTSLTIFAAIGLLSLIVGITVALFGLSRFHISGDFLSTARYALIVVSIDVALGFPLGVFAGILFAHQRYDIYNGLRIITTCLNAIAVVTFLSIGYGIIALAMITLLINLLRNLLIMIFVIRWYNIMPYFQIGDRQTLSLIFNYSWISFICGMAVNLIYYTDSIIIGSFISAGAITYFAIATNLIEYSRRLVSSFTGVLHPVVSDLESRKKGEDIQRLMIIGTRVSLLIAIPLCSMWFIMGDSFISLWMGEEYRELSGNIFKILIFSQLPVMSQFTSYVVLMNTGYHKANAVIITQEAILNLLISLLLIRPLGLIGVALGTAIPSLLTNTIIMPLYTTRKISLPLREYFSKAYRAPLIASIPSIIILVMIKNYYSFDSMIAFFFAMALWGVATLGTYWVLCFEQIERSFVIHHVRRMGRLLYPLT